MEIANVPQASQAGFQIVSMGFFGGFCWGVNDVSPANWHFNDENYD
jgi:hypothetical protein